MRFLTYEDLRPGDLAAKVAKVRGCIERDDFRSPDVKKLGFRQYYRAKLDASNRLLLQFVQFRDEVACLALEVLRNHDYNRSRFLRGTPVEEARIEAEEVAERPAVTPVRYLHPSFAEFTHLDKPISWDDAQRATLAHPAPQVIVGSAGSGKTALLLSHLRRATGRVAYVTESRWLAEVARDLYVANDGAPEDQDVDFLSYSQLLDTIQSPAGRPVTFRDFLAYYQAGRRSLGGASAHQVFEEFRGVLTCEPEGPLTREAYLGLGVRQSLFEPGLRPAVYDLFERYPRWLEEKGLYEPNLVAHALLPRAEPTYRFLVVDEVQDLTNVQLSLILGLLAQPGQFVVAGDANQVVHPNLFSWSKLKSLLWRGVGVASEHQVHLLSLSYRNSDEVTRVANRILQVKQMRFGSIDRESNQLMRPMGAETGAVRIVTNQPAMVQDLNSRTRQSAQVAVLVLRDEDKASARQALATPLIFSIQEAKGLEYDTVILWRFLATERATYAEIAGELKAADLTDTDSLAYRRARDKADKTAERLKFFVNALYVGISRAVREVVLVEDDPNHPLARLLSVERAADLRDLRANRSSADDWQREARRLEAQGKSEQADAIRRDVLKIVPVPWAVLDRPSVMTLLKAARVPGPAGKTQRKKLIDFSITNYEMFHAHHFQMLEGYLDPERTKGQLKASIYNRHAAVKNRPMRQHLTEIARYGADYRLAHGRTLLMEAAAQGQVELVEALLERGAKRSLVDPLGRNAAQTALLGFLADEVPPHTLVRLWDLLAPPSFDVLVNGRLVQIGKEKAEYFAFSWLAAVLSRVRAVFPGSWRGLTADVLEVPASLPQAIWPDARRKRSYLNALLARNEVGSSYRPARRLFQRGLRGYYFFNPSLHLRVASTDPGADPAGVWTPIDQALNFLWVDETTPSNGYPWTHPKHYALGEEARSKREQMDESPSVSLDPTAAPR